MKCGGCCRRAGMPSKPAVQAVFFDLDDTLCDSIGARPERARKALENFCRYHPEHDLEEIVARVLQPDPTLDREVRGLRRIFAELGLEESEGARAAYDIHSSYFTPIHCFEGVPETLQALSQQFVLGVITNFEEWYQRRKFEQLPIVGLISHFVVADMVGFEKPDPRIFAHALSLAGVAAREAVFVGDRLDVDIAGARGAGMRAVWFNHWGGSLDGAPATPDAVIERFNELPEVLAAM